MNPNSLVRSLLLAVLFLMPVSLMAWEGMDMPELYVRGRYLVDSHDNAVTLHGFAQTYSPQSNEGGTKWSDYDVEGCLQYSKEQIDRVLAAGWDVNLLRLHMDPYWSNKPGVTVTGESDISAFDQMRFRKYVNEVFVPMAEYAVSHGLYVVMRAPGVCPDRIAVGDDYQRYLITLWTIVARNQKLKNHQNIMYELATDPVEILGTDGVYGSVGQPCFDAMKAYFQPVVDAMRAEGCHNVLWVPGLGHQSSCSGYANSPIDGDNIGYALHVSPGCYGNTADSYATLKAGWDKEVRPAANIAPIMVTETGWAPEKYNSTSGNGITGDEAQGFGANFMRLCDETGNVSWLLSTEAHVLAQFEDKPGAPGEYTYLNDPEACPWPVYHKYQEYRAQHQYPWPDFSRKLTSDCGNGYYNNPVINSDFPDVDMIRVGDTYYMMSTTMFLFPGATIMRSYDLVNWEYCANPIDYIEHDDAYNLEKGQNRYSHGMWASAFQYHNGTFYILFNTLNEGAYLMTATDIEGKWTKRRLNHSFYDCGLLFDGDDIYVVRGNTEIWIDRVDENFNVLESHKVIVGPSDNAVEGSRIYHIGDYYYVYSCYSGWPGKQTCFRSHDIFGPYEEKLLLDDRTIHQGAMVQTEKGDWWTILHRDLWPWGRVPYLMPITFDGGWPLIAKDCPNVDYLQKPSINSKHPTPYLHTTDVFRQYVLGKQWQWNHNADASKWSLIDRAGYLRLYTASVTDNIYQARNTLTQRMVGSFDDKAHNYGTVAMDITHMAEGDHAGLGVMQDPWAGIGVKVVNGEKHLYYFERSFTNKITPIENDCGIVSGNTLYLRAVASFESPGKVNFYYSTDNATYTKIGKTWTMQYDLSVFVGNRYTIFNYATQALGGYVDVDWFSTEPEFSEDIYYPAEFAGYSKESLTVSKLSTEAKDLVIMTGATVSLSITAEYKDGHTDEVAAMATYKVADPTIAEVEGGKLKALRDGKTSIMVIYQDPLGKKANLKVNVECSTFPLTADLFNPSIYAEGTFDEDSHTVVTGQYGFAGWHYNAGVDLSGYRYIVAKLDKPAGGGVSFRLFDENNYWAGCAVIDKKTSPSCDYFVADLHGTWREDKSRLIDPTHIYYVGFWSYGGTPFVVQEVYVTNDDDYLTGALDRVPLDIDAAVDVYSIDGMLLLRGVQRSEALRQLKGGLYIIGGSKVMLVK